MDVPAGWSDGLSVTDFTAIISKAEEINGGFFAQWQARRERRRKLLPKADMGEMVSMVEALNRANPQLLDGIVKKAVAESGERGAGS